MHNMKTCVGFHHGFALPSADIFKPQHKHRVLFIVNDNDHIYIYITSPEDIFPLGFRNKEGKKPPQDWKVKLRKFTGNYIKENFKMLKNSVYEGVNMRVLDSNNVQRQKYRLDVRDISHEP